VPFGTILAATTGKRSSFGSKYLPSNPYAASVGSGDARLNAQRDQDGRYTRPILGSGNLSGSDDSRLNLRDCRFFSPESPFGALVSEAAHRAGVAPRTLAVSALLHLPRVASYGGWVMRWQVQRELETQTERLCRDARAARSYVSFESFALGDLRFEKVDSSRALPVLTLLHYLRSARPGSLYFALVDPLYRLPVTLCSLSQLQWKCVGSHIRSRFAIPPQRIWDVSRVYSVDTAPRNAISMLLSRVRTYMRHNMPSASLLLTAVDPNLGFTGGSYRAANWQHWMTIRARPYIYERGRYVSPRQLREGYGTASLVELQAKYPGRFQQSKVRLLDSIIYCCNVNGETRVLLAEDRRRLHR
jgi:hypothetical protein